MQQLMPIIITLNGYWGIQMTIVYSATVETRLKHEMCFPKAVLNMVCVVSDKENLIQWAT